MTLPIPCFARAAALTAALTAALAAGLALGAARAASADPPARAVFGAAAAPAAGAPAPIGEHARGCLAGGARLAETGPSWQAMRLSRDRAWGHPQALAFVARLGAAAQALGWPRVLVGDISQPRGGPMRSGHRSHQIGLDIDVWLTRPDPAPLSPAAREALGAASVVAADRKGVNGRWSGGHAALLRAASLDPRVARIFVNAAIKRQLCAWAGPDRDWLRKVRPWWGHDAHFHVRLRCPEGAGACVDQSPPPAGDGCDASLAWWFSDEALNPPPPDTPAKPRAPLRLSELPPACAAVADAP
jgi:penicillin-insensitive murein endopeptidase